MRAVLMPTARVTPTMSIDPVAALAMLQLADSALPIGRFVHSHGLEAWLRDHPEPSATQLAELVEAVVCESIAPLDGAVLVWAHRARTLDALQDLDRRLTARKLAPGARAASLGCGRQFAALAAQLAMDDALVQQLSAAVQARESDGNLAVVSGTVARALGIAERDAILVELRGAAGALLSAAVRLGALAPTRAQLLMLKLAPALVAAANRARATPVDHLSATAPELELFALAHAHADARLFSS